MPTIAALVNISGSNLPQNLDGIDQSQALKSRDKPSNLPLRDEIVLDLYTAGESIFGKKSLVAFRKGDMKLIQGLRRDGNWYTESSTDRLNTTDPSWYSIIGEALVRTSEWVYGPSRFDTAHHVFVHGFIMNLFQVYSEDVLYNITADPCEIADLSKSNPQLMKEMLARAEELKTTAIKQQPVYLELVDEIRESTWINGDCSRLSSSTGELRSNCHFLHPWLPDDVDPSNNDNQTLRDGRIHVKEIAATLVKLYVAGFTAIILMLCGLFYLSLWYLYHM